VAEPAGPGRSWLPALAVAGCIAIELAMATAPVGFAVRVAALLALASTAVALSLRQALGGLASRALRLAVMGPVVFSIVLTVVLTLDACARRGGLLR